MDNDVDKGFAFSELVTVNGGRCFHPNADRITMIVDIDASDYLVNDELTPRLRGNMREYKKLMEPKIIDVHCRKQESIGNGNWHYPGTHHRSGWAVFQFISLP